MTDQEAEQIIDFLFGMLRPPDPLATRAAWVQQLSSLDAEVASRAAVNGSRVWDRFPTWPTFYAEYRSLLEHERLATAAPCQTCGGDLFVVVATRRAQTTEWMKERGLLAPSDRMIDEYAPCPDCQAAGDTSFYRFDGSFVDCPDPAMVRKLLSN